MKAEQHTDIATDAVPESTLPSTDAPKPVSKQMLAPTLFDILYDRIKLVPGTSDDVKKPKQKTMAFEHHIKNIFKSVAEGYPRSVVRSSQLKYAMNEFTNQFITRLIKAVYDHTIKRKQTTVIGESLLLDLCRFLSTDMSKEASAFAEHALIQYKESISKKANDDDKRISQSARAGLIFSVSAVERKLRAYVSKRTDKAAGGQSTDDASHGKTLPRKQISVSHTSFIIISAVVEYTLRQIARALIERCIENKTSVRYSDFMALAEEDSQIGDTLRKLNVMFRIPYGGPISHADLFEILRAQERIDNTKPGAKRKVRRSINEEIATILAVRDSPYTQVRNTAIRGIKKSLNELDDMYPQFKTMANSNVIRLIASTTERFMIEYFKFVAPILKTQGKTTLQEDLAVSIGKFIFSRMYNIRPSFLNEEAAVRFTKDAVKSFGKCGLVLKTSKGAKAYVAELTRAVACTIYHNAAVDAALEKRKTIRPSNVISGIAKMNVMMI